MAIEKKKRIKEDSKYGMVIQVTHTLQFLYICVRSL